MRLWIVSRLDSGSLLVLPFIFVALLQGGSLAMSSSSTTRNVAAKLRVVSYNVLSSHLSSPSYYSTLQPEHLDPAARLKKVLSKLECEMSQATESSRLPVFCLQEVSYDWASALHTFFAQRNYHVITGLYGKKFNGYMGILTAYPVAELETVSVDICRLSDTVESWPTEPKESSLSRWVRSIVTPALKFVGVYKEPPESHWSISERRNNVMLTAVLKEKNSQQAFTIGNYHMPCCFYAPMVMVMHCDMCLAHVQSVARKNGAATPYLLAGDFNIKPGTAPYQLLTTGLIDKGDPVNYPSPPVFAPEFKWKPTITEPARSAYASYLGQEPDFTNYARAKEDDAFIDTLDYIFISESVTVQGVRPLAHRDSEGVDGPFPNEVEPSDHILIAVDVDVIGL